jgi:hypothetical protein
MQDDKKVSEEAAAQKPAPALPSRVTCFGGRVSVSKRALLVAVVVALALVALAIALILCERFGVFDSHGYVPPICTTGCSAANHSYWDGILKRHVRAAVRQGVNTTVFDYAALRAVRERIASCCALLCATTRLVWCRCVVWCVYACMYLCKYST